MSREYTIHIDDAMYEQMLTVQKITGTSPEEAAASGIAQWINPFRNTSGNISPAPGHLAAYGPDGENIACYILGEATIFGQPYLRLYVNGEIVCAPANKVVRYVSGHASGEKQTER